jgi:hypothetical protein
MDCRRPVTGWRLAESRTINVPGLRQAVLPGAPRHRQEEIMSIVALTTWLITATGGLYLFAVWLIEHDGSKRGGTASRLRAPVVFSHVTLAVGGLIVWVVYLYVDKPRLAWAAFFILLPVVLLGLIMLTRWIPVHRAANAGVAYAGPARSGSAAVVVGPPERNFPVPVVVAHGAFAAVTLVLVALTALGVGGS